MGSADTKEKETAIFAVTARGAELGRRLKVILPGSQLYLPEKIVTVPGINEHIFSPTLKKSVARAFNEYRYLVLIMSTGIAVRLLARVIKDKHTDPGIVVVDDTGIFVISLLSGHVGGANELAEKVAGHIGATPVITTASDIIGTIAVDLLGKEHGWEIEESKNLTSVSADVVSGEPVGIYQESGERGWWSKKSPLPANVQVFRSIRALLKTGPRAALLITDRVLDEKEFIGLPRHTLIYRPKSLVIGIGCNRGTGRAEIEEAVSDVLSKYRLSIKSIRNLATIDIKKNEPGLLEFAR